MDDRLIARVSDYSARNALLVPDEPVLALVSGGADSTCLVHMLRAIHAGPVDALVFDHGLRAGSRQEADRTQGAVRSIADRVWVRHLELEPGPGVQERARHARRDAANEIAEECGHRRIATGHTASDQAETVLFRIARGTGRTGALGMAPIEGAWIKPLLCVTRDETRGWCAARGLAVVDDPSNEDPRYARSRVRHGLVAALEDVHPAASRAVARLADQLRDEAALLEPMVDAAWRRCLSPGGGLSVDALGREPGPLGRLLVRRLLAAGGISPDALWVDRTLAAVTAGTGRFDAPGGTVDVARGVARVFGPLPAPALLAVPGEATLDRVRVSARHGTAEPPDPRRVAVAVDGPFTVRCARPGDRLSLPGGGRQSVASLLAGQGVAAAERARVAVVASGERVVWVAGYRADPTLLAPPGAPATLLEVFDA